MPHALGLLALGLTTQGCGDLVPGGRPRSLVVVTIDTLRADRLGCYGHPGGLTPNLDRVASRGVVFDDATAPVPLTLPSHASLFTGRYPTEHGVRNNGTFVLDPGETTLAEVLREAGWRTGAVIAAYPLQARFGLDQGFERFEQDFTALPVGQRRGPMVHFPERPAKEVTDNALALWRELGAGGRFLWVHYFDPHAPYAPPEPFGGDTPAARYDGEVAYTDREVGRLLNALEREDPEAIVAVVADHGEGLDEHGEKSHGVFLYQSTLRVPFLLRAPGQVPEGRHVGTPVSLVDLMPTLLSLVGVESPGGMQGADLTELIAGAPEPTRPVYAESYLPRLQFRFSELRALRRGSLKYIDAPRPELYDLALDPGETRGFDAGSPEAAAIAEVLRGFSDPTGGFEDPTTPLDPEAIATLRGLGYLAAGTLERAPEEAKHGRGRDPKDMTDYLRCYDQGVALISEGRFEEAVSALRRLGPQAPENYMLHYQIAAALIGLGRHAEAERELAPVLSAAPALADTHLLLATVRGAQGHMERAIESYRQAARLAPDAGQPLYAMARFLESRGRFDLAADAYRDALEREPEQREYSRHLLQLLASRGDHERAVREFEALSERHPRAPGLWTCLALARRASGDLAGALRDLGRAAVLDPSSYGTLVQLGELQLERGEVGAAQKVFRDALAARPSGKEARFGLARTLLEQDRLAEADAELGRLLQLDPGFSQAHTVRGRYLEARGDILGASRAYHQALQANPGDRQAREGLRRVSPGS